MVSSTQHPHMCSTRATARVIVVLTYAFSSVFASLPLPLGLESAYTFLLA